MIPKNFDFSQKRDRFAPSRVLIVKNWAGYAGEAARHQLKVFPREIQLPFDEIAEALMGPEGDVVVYDVRELLRDIDRLKQHVLEIVNTCSAPLTDVNGTESPRS